MACLRGKLKGLLMGKPWENRNGDSPLSVACLQLRSFLKTLPGQEHMDLKFCNSFQTRYFMWARQQPHEDRTGGPFLFRKKGPRPSSPLCFPDHCRLCHGHLVLGDHSAHVCGPWKPRADFQTHSRPGAMGSRLVGTHTNSMSDIRLRGRRTEADAAKSSGS